MLRCARERDLPIELTHLQRWRFSGRLLRTLSATAVLWGFGVAVGSLLPVAAKQAIGTMGPLHDLLHVVAFGGAAILFAALMRRRVFGAALAAAATAVVAILLEGLQHGIYGNPFEWNDVFVDLGAIAGGYLGVIASARYVDRRASATSAR